MYYILDLSTDPYWNLAAEEYLLKNFNKPVFRLWQNSPSVIIGLHQNAYAEINLEFVKRGNIPVVRRLSGGGAVFHDLGNINFTFIDTLNTDEDSSAMFSRFTSPIISALNNIGINAQLKGRNDLVIDDKKFSGNAIAIYKNRVLQHGTLLFKSNINSLSSALQSRPEHFKGKSVQSVKSRVTNIWDHLSEKMSVEEFIQYIQNYITQTKNSYQLYKYTTQDIINITKLKIEKYSLDSWNYGKSPKYTFSKVLRFEGGLIESYLTIEKGVIIDINIYGSYFFNKETIELERLLKGINHTPESVKEVIKDINLSDYINNITEEEFINLIF